jgi:hypothetical protein
MILRAMGFVLVAAATFLVSAPVKAQTLKAEEARKFVAGKFFSFNCFEGTRGAGRIMSDGSVAGSIQLAGSGPTRHVQLPPNTLQVRGEAVCASMKGMFFEPCFNVVKTNNQSFRGSVSGMGFAYCDFVGKDNGNNGRVRMARSLSRSRANAAPVTTGSIARPETAALELRSSQD